MEQRLFQDLIESDTKRHGTRQSATMPFSAGLHALIALLVVIVPILQPAELPEPGSLVKAFFVEPAAAPAPPPPPPPPAPRAVRSTGAAGARGPERHLRGPHRNSQRDHTRAELPRLRRRGRRGRWCRGWRSGWCRRWCRRRIARCSPAQGRGRSRGRAGERAEEAEERPARLSRNRQVGPCPGHRHSRMHDQPPGQGHQRHGPAQHTPARRRGQGSRVSSGSTHRLCSMGSRFPSS